MSVDIEQAASGPGKYGWASGWLTEFRCVCCGKAMSYYEKMHSHGRCGMCGFHGHRGSTVVAVKEVPYRLRRRAPRWKFWVRPERVYGGAAVPGETVSGSGQ